MDLSAEQIRDVLINVLTLVVSVALHEFGHAFVADRLGDDTPRRQGRLTLNPVAHADPIGTLALPLIASFSGFGAFGWGKPVQVQPQQFTRRFSVATGNLMVAIAGPTMNLLLGTFIAIVHVALLANHVLDNGPLVGTYLAKAVYINYLLFFFNLVPVAPLDGGTVLQRFVPYRHRATVDKVMVYGPFIVLLVILPPLNKIFLVPARFLGEHVYQALGALFF